MESVYIAWMQHDDSEYYQATEVFATLGGAEDYIATLSHGGAQHWIERGNDRICRDASLSWIWYHIYNKELHA